MRKFTVLLVLVACGPAAMAGDSLRCGQSLLSSDSTVREFLEKCGEPTHKEVSVEDVWGKTGLGGTEVVGKTKIEKWTYERNRQFPVVVTIVDGQVKAVEAQIR